jgi:cellulose synthase operon protein C
VAAFYWFAGVIYENKQDWGQAEQQYKKVLEIQPENALASNNLAFVMLEQGGNVDLAFTMAQTAYRQLPDNASSADTLGWAFYYKRAYTSAITHFKEALRREPENEHFNYHLGMAYAKNGQVDLARQQQKLLRRINPKSPDLEKLQEAIDEAKG